MENVPTLPASFHDLPADEEDSYTVQLIRLVITEASVTGSVGNTLGELMRAVRGELIGRAVLRS